MTAHMTLPRHPKNHALEINDLAELENLSADFVCQALQYRFKANRVYTYVGNVLIALNPFSDLGLFTDEFSAMYSGSVAQSSKDTLLPHLYAIANNAYMALLRDNTKQVCVISGESGAGKTVSAKQFIRQLMDVSGRGMVGKDSDKDTVLLTRRHRHPIEQKIVDSNPILEAFGNAQTVMNNNSSRFGKFIEVLFDDNHKIAGGSLSHYLLEKGRIVKQSPLEGNFHVFKFMFAGCSRERLDTCFLRSYGDYRLLPADKASNAAFYKHEWNEVVRALRNVGFIDEEIESVIAVVAAVLHLGEVQFEEDDNCHGVTDNRSPLEHAVSCLCVDELAFETALTTVRLNLREGVVEKRLDRVKCRDAALAVAKVLYGKLFDWIVLRIDGVLRPRDQFSATSSQVIGILDVFGFEKFAVNGFDQMCINLANEQLHYFFNEKIFSDELQAYKEEGLGVLDVYFTDNKHVFDMFLRKPLGFLALMDEEASFTHSTDRSMLMKLNKYLKEDSVYLVSKGSSQFGVKHYAGDVIYTVDGFLEKNKDPLPEMVPSVLQASDNHLVAMLLHPRLKEIVQGSETQDKVEKAKGAPMRSRRLSQDEIQVAQKAINSAKSKISKSNENAEAKASVSAQFAESLSQLMQRMGMCEPHFIRCIKPNVQQIPLEFDAPLVSRQLQYLGIMETVKMRREGYPHRVEFKRFYNTYNGCVNMFSGSEFSKGHLKVLCDALKEKSIQMVQRSGKKPTNGNTFSNFLIARSRVFLKYWHLDVLEGLLVPFRVAALKIQTLFRGYQARKAFFKVVLEYRNMKQVASSFFDTLTILGKQLSSTLNTIALEEKRKGPEKLGIVEKMSKKEEAKLQKKAVKEFSEKNRQKFEKELQKCKKNVVKWWQKFERPTRIHLNAEDTIHPWFHGLISRTEAEEFLFDQEHGSFLVRVSERAQGYALSFVFNNWIRHYKLEHQNYGGYKIAGADETFTNINDLLLHYQENALSEDNDMIGSPLIWEHDLRLGIQERKADYMEASSELTSVKNPKARRKSSALLALDVHEGDDLESVMSVNYYLNLSNNPSWLRGKMSREDAEEELYELGNVDGRFIVREKLMARQRVVFALTYSVRDEYYHHLLIKNGAAGDFLLNEGSLGCMYLDEAIRKFQERRYPGLATRLESDPRSRRTFVPEHSSGSRWRDDARRHHGSRDERGASRDRKIHGKKKKKATKKKKKRRNR